MSGRRCFLSACCVVAFSCGLSAGGDNAAATKVDGSPVKRLMVRLNARFGVERIAQVLQYVSEFDPRNNGLVATAGSGATKAAAVAAAAD